MAAIPFMPLYVADYLADAAHLTTEEHGAYLLLIMTYWQRGKPLVYDPERLARVSRLSNERWTSVEQTLSEFFVLDGGCWHHKRIDAELERVREKSEKARKAGSASASARKVASVEHPLNGRSNGGSTVVEQTLNHTDTDTDADRERENARAPEPPHWQEVDKALSVAEALDAWEMEFLHSIRSRRRLTDAQRESLTTIMSRTRTHKPVPKVFPSVKRGTPAFDAWIAYYRSRGKAAFYERLDAITVPSEFPPEDKAA